MAWLEQEKTGIDQICFRYQGQRIKKSARTRDERKAQSMLGRIEENIELVERGPLRVPDDSDMYAFLLSYDVNVRLRLAHVSTSFRVGPKTHSHTVHGC